MTIGQAKFDPLIHRHSAQVNGIALRCVEGGEGALRLLVHDCPET